LHEWFSHADPAALVDIFRQGEAVRSEYDDGRSMLEPAHLFALRERKVHASGCRAVAAHIGAWAEKVETNAGHQDGRDSNQRDAVISAGEADSRSFLQNRRSMRLRAIGLTFHVSPEM
jgi:hypothetical protein